MKDNKLCIHLTIKEQEKRSNNWDSEGDNMIRFAYHNARKFYDKAMATYSKKYTEKETGTLLLGHRYNLKISAREGHVYISISLKDKK